MKKILLTTVFIFLAIGLWRNDAVVSRSGGSSPKVTPETDFVFIGKARLSTAGPDSLGIAGTMGFAFGSGDYDIKYAPGSFIGIRHPDGRVTKLVTPDNPLQGNLIDIQSVDVSFDGRRIVFSAASPDHYNQFRIYEINLDGSGFRQLTFNDRKFSGSAYPYVAAPWYFYDDVDPIHQADGSIIFASTRRVSKTHELQMRSFNLYRIFPNEQRLCAPERITHFVRFSARFPAALPDGRLIFSRWWNQFNQARYQVQPQNDEWPSVAMRIDVNPPVPEGTLLPDGTRVIPSPGLFLGEFADFSGVKVIYPDSFQVYEATDEWDLAVIENDGSDLRRYANTSDALELEPLREYDQFGVGYSDMNVQMPAIWAYGGQVQRIASVRAHHGSAYLGIKFLADLKAHYPRLAAGANHGVKLAEGRFVYPAFAEDGTVFASKAYEAPVIDGGEFDNLRGYTLPLKTSYEKFRPVAISPDGMLTELPIALSDDYDAIQFEPMAPRLDWVWPMKRGEPTSDDPIDESAPPYGRGRQMATVFNPNVYAQTPLGGQGAPFQFVRSSPPIGRVAYADIMVDAFRFTPDDDLTRERAMLWKRVEVSPAGAFGPVEVPAYAGLFVILRDAEGKIIHADSTWRHGFAASIAQGEGYALPNEQVKCVGCHLHHQSGALPDQSDEEVKWTNVAPSAYVSASSVEENRRADHVADRRATQEFEWRSEYGVTTAVARLEWPMAMEIRGATLYGSTNEYLDPSYRVTSGRIRLLKDEVSVYEEPFGEVPPVQDGVLEMSWAAVTANAMEVLVESINNGEQVALAEIEVNGKVKEVTTGIKQVANAPKNFLLEQNYPNPFNPQTNIRYHLPAAGQTTLTVFNLLGEKVQTLVNGWEPAGVHTVMVDASRLPSGIYFYRLESNGLHQVRKMVLTR